jgi:hypothetical protein
MTQGEYVIVTAGELAINQKFETIHTGGRGIVRERYELLVDGVAMMSPRVLMVNGRGKVEHKTLHPMVLVKAIIL